MLVVEDDPSVLAMTVSILKRRGYRVLSAASIKQCRQVLDKNSGSLDMVVTDVVMPEMNGKELVDYIKTGYPQIKVLFMSGYTDDIIVNHGVLDNGVHFIQKPFTVKELADQVRKILDNSD